MNRIAKKALISTLLLILLSAGLVLTGMGNDKTKGVVPGTQPKSQEVASETPAMLSPLGDGTSMTWPLVKLVFALGIVIIAIYGFLFLLRRMMGQKMSGNRSRRLIEVIETAHIAQKKSVSVIRFHDRAILIGICDGSMQRLAELDPDESAAALAEAETESAPGKFAGVLSEAKTRLKSWNVGRMLTKNAARDLESPQAI